MRLITAIVGSLFMFLAISLIVGFVATRVVDGMSDAWQLGAWAITLAAALAVAYSSFRATMRIKPTTP